MKGILKLAVKESGDDTLNILDNHYFNSNNNNNTNYDKGFAVGLYVPRRENPALVAFEHQRHILTYASAQFDQRIYYLLVGKYNN